MVLSAWIKFIDASLASTGPLALPYTDPDLKWIIRKHLLALLQDFPSLTLSTNAFTYDDGTTVHLLNACGSLRVSSAAPPVPLIIWLQDRYPYAPPLVYLSLTPATAILPHHPFVDPSGATNSPYLNNWFYPGSNLSGLAHNLINLFTHYPPFFLPNFPLLAKPSFASKREALDRLVGNLHRDMVALRSQVEEDIDELWRQQAVLSERHNDASTILSSLESEHTSLKQRLKEMADDSDMLVNWLMVHDPHSPAACSKDAFEEDDEESRLIVENMAEDNAIDDLVYALDKAFEKGVVPLVQYLKLVRILSREQFFHRNELVNPRNPYTETYASLI